MAMRTLKIRGPLFKRPEGSPYAFRDNPSRESRGPETCPSLERDADPHGRYPAERGNHFDDGLTR